MVVSSTRSAAALLAVLAIAGCAPGGSVATTPPSQTQSAQPAATPSGSPAPSDAEGPLTIYSGRSEELVAPAIDQFTETTGVEVEVRYGDTAEMASTILEEGENSPADLFFAQDAGALGAVAAEARAASLPQQLLERVDQRFRSPDGTWVGVSGRARVVVYSPERVPEAELPDSILDFTDARWKGRLGWAPTNGSFQAFVTALRVTHGDHAAHSWLEGIQANEPAVFDGNMPIVEAVAAGEIDAGFVNHYYLMRQLAEQGDDYPAANHFLSGGDPGALVNVAGVAVLSTTDQPAAATAFVDYLLSPDAQEYFATETYEYPLIEGVAVDPRLPALSEIESPNIDLSDLQDLDGTLDLLADVGVL